MFSFSLLQFFLAVTLLQFISWCRADKTPTIVTVESFERENRGKRFLKTAWDKNTQAFKVSFTGKKEEKGTSKYRLPVFFFFRFVLVFTFIGTFFLLNCQIICHLLNSAAVKTRNLFSAIMKKVNGSGLAYC